MNKPLSKDEYRHMLKGQTSRPFRFFKNYKGYEAIAGGRLGWRMLEKAKYFKKSTELTFDEWYDQVGDWPFKIVTRGGGTHFMIIVTPAKPKKDE